MRTNIVICIVACLLGVGLLFASNSAAALAIVLVSVSVPILSVVFGRIVARDVRMTLTLEKSCTVGQPLSLGICVERSPLWRGRIGMQLECRNVITGGVERVPATLLPSAGAVEHFSLPMNTACCGTVEVSLAEVYEFDPLGFVKTPISHMRFSSSYIVYPELVDMAVRVNQAVRADNLGAEYDRHKKGQDPTEVLDMRTFRQGDSLKRVHWKLSARMEDLIVREPSLPADCDVAIVAAVEVGDAADSNRIPVFDATLSLVSSISLSLLRQGIVHEVSYSQGDAIGIESVDGRSSFDGMLDVLMSTQYPPKARLQSELALVDQWQAIHKVAKTVLVTNFISEALFSKLSEITNLTVVYVGADTALGISDDTQYPVVHIDAASVGASVKSLEL